MTDAPARSGPYDCSACGRPAGADESPLTWSTETQADGSAVRVCPECTRSNVRAIEAKLDREWW